MSPSFEEAGPCLYAWLLYSTLIVDSRIATVIIHEDNPSWVILSLDVKESHSLYIYMNIFGVVVSR